MQRIMTRFALLRATGRRGLFTLLLLCHGAPAMSQSTTSRSATDREAIAEIVARVAYEADAGKWEALRSLYADEVRVDYTSLAGGEPASVRADDLMANWRALLPGFDLTQHLLGPIVVEIDGDRAVARTHVRALHRIAGAEGGEDWIVGGHYIYQFARSDGRWRITGHTLARAYKEGNRMLPDLARKRLERAPTNRPRTGMRGR